MNSVFVSIGGNIGDQKVTQLKVIKSIESKVGKMLSQSKLYQTPPWGYDDENDYLNQVILIETKYSAEQVLKKLLHIENEYGRVRDQLVRYTSRTIDLDILYYNNEIISNGKRLIIPHPRLHLRKFNLLPLCDINPNYIHPELGLSNQQLLINCTDDSLIKKL